MSLDRLHFWMNQALEEARLAFHAAEVPVGAVLVQNNTCVARARNTMNATHNPCMHAEMQLIAQGTSCAQRPFLDGHEVYVTLEPCPMCAHALRLAHIPVIYFGAYDPRGGAIDHGPRLFEDPAFFRPQAYGGILEQESQCLLKAFFQGLR